MNNPFIISSCKTYTTYSEFFIVSQNIIAFPHRRWLAAYVPTHHIRRHTLTSSNCDRYMRSAKCTSTDRVIKCDDRPIPISGRSIGASLIFIIIFYSYYSVHLNYSLSFSIFVMFFNVLLVFISFNLFFILVLVVLKLLMSAFMSVTNAKFQMSILAKFFQFFISAFN